MDVLQILFGFLSAGLHCYLSVFMISGGRRSFQFEPWFWHGHGCKLAVLAFGGL